MKGNESKANGHETEDQMAIISIGDLTWRLSPS
jgi:hypothetical protein